jgi:anhydro-N-acetylmuramic acid kinase
MRIAGVMSGTSLDGIDVAVIDVGRHTPRTIGFQTTPYPATLRSAIFAANTAAEISRLGFRLA